MSEFQQTVLITGASGRLGRKVVAIAAQRQDVLVIAATRSPEKLQDLEGKNVKVRHVDFDQPEGLAESFAGVNRLLLVSTDELHEPGKRIAQHKAAIDAAREAGVEHIIYTSMPAPDSTEKIPFAPDHSATERALKESGVSHTILRVAWYAENLIELGILPLAISTGRWITSAGSGQIAYVTRLDVARAACAALLDANTVNRTLDISGPKALTVPEMAAIIGRILQRELQVVQVGDEELMEELLAAKICPNIAPMIVATDGNTRENNFNIVSNAILNMTGQPPADFSEFTRQIFNTLV